MHTLTIARCWKTNKTEITKCTKLPIQWYCLISLRLTPHSHCSTSSSAASGLHGLMPTSGHVSTTALGWSGYMFQWGGKLFTAWPGTKSQFMCSFINAANNMKPNSEFKANMCLGVLGASNTCNSKCQHQFWNAHQRFCNLTKNIAKWASENTQRKGENTRRKGEIFFGDFLCTIGESDQTFGVTCGTDIPLFCNCLGHWCKKRLTCYKNASMCFSLHSCHNMWV